MLRTKRERTLFVLAAGAVSFLLFFCHQHPSAAPDALKSHPHYRPVDVDAVHVPSKPGHDAEHAASPPLTVVVPDDDVSLHPLPAASESNSEPPMALAPFRDAPLPVHPPAADMIPPPPDPALLPPQTIPTGYAPPRLTLIVLWSPQDREHNYLPNFFASAAANPTIDILLIKFDKYGVGGDECNRPRSPDVANVREVCVDMDEYWDLHVNYLCQHWKCSKQQMKRVREVMVGRRQTDRVNSFYRPFRAEVFKKYMLPEVKFWAWGDLDVILGSFERVFPWDVADQFDVILAGWPTNWDNILLYMPGHMTAFRNSPAVAAQFLATPALATFDAFVGDDFISEACEEGEYSHHLFMRSGLTFLRFDAMVDTVHHISTLDGVFGIENDGWAERDRSDEPAESALVRLAPQINDALRQHSASARPRATFTSAGHEAKVDIVNDGSRAPFLWFGAQYAVMYHSVLGREVDGNGRAMRRYAMRREPHGPVMERFEPEEPFLVPAREPRGDWAYGTHNRPWLREALYNHLQTEKYKRWWSLPREALKPGDVLYMDKEHGAHLWDKEGALLWHSARVDQEMA
ncbi:hypothetical protein K488DRAFT_84587 [Vararia minispora EC-137]|uniref:Uncharacterized protein n=1 Tax=Vararia minispora EC-137 TaxID=1314806 RepID=A0ACB8QQ72_9AGAM|nr:hypothetical protein K488DRAFT_84587 [Vararia minispora EC-137]